MNNCEQWEPALHDYSEGLLPPELADRVKAHLDSCEGCRQRLTEWEQVGQLLSELPMLPAPVVPLQVVQERKPLFHPSQVAALWFGIALPGAWVLHQLAATINWQVGAGQNWFLQGLSISPWFDSIRHWAERLTSYY